MFCKCLATVKQHYIVRNRYRTDYIIILVGIPNNIIAINNNLPENVLRRDRQEKNKNQANKSPYLPPPSLTFLLGFELLNFIKSVLSSGLPGEMLC